jgi:hypothetical protein
MMFAWIQDHKAILEWMGVVSFVSLVIGLIVAFVIAVRIPADYFACRGCHGKTHADQHPVVRALLLIAKNLLGYIFIAAGILMLVLPGQGVLTILAGVMMLNFPGKYRLERWIISRPTVLEGINLLRQRAGREPLVLDSKESVQS